MRTFTSLLLFAFVASSAMAEGPIPYKVGKWPEEWGNHRAVVQVSQETAAVWAHIPWRRRDANPEQKAVIVVDAATEQRLANTVVAEFTMGHGDILFQPVTAPGKYFIYYLPSRQTGSTYFPGSAYQAPVDTADAAWRSSLALEGDSEQPAAWRELPRAELLALEAIDEYDKFTDMERTATDEELRQFLARHASADYLLFPEDRRQVIRMQDHLPHRWIELGPRDSWEGQPCRGEFYAFQVGVFAARRAIGNVQISAEDLVSRSDAGSTIPASELHCFNTGGVDCLGRPFQQEFSVENGKVRALWFGMQIPVDAKPGWYDGAVRVEVDGQPAQRIRLHFEIQEATVADHGDAEPWRHSRLRWLDSTIGLQDEPTRPLTPLELDGNTLRCLGRDVTLDEMGLPRQIRSYFSPEVTQLDEVGREILADPIRFVVGRADGSELAFRGESFEIVRQTPGTVAWQSQSSCEALQLRCFAEMCFDGHLTYRMQLSATRATEIADLRLEIPLRREAARYMMGMGRPGGLRPAEFRWQWDSAKNQDSVWLGDVNAGLRCRLFGENYRRPVVNIHYRHVPLNLPPGWHNGGKGDCTIREEGGDRVVLRAAGGPRTVEPGQTLHFNFTLLITPLKPLDTDGHWQHRYCHARIAPEEIAQAGANVVNIHHGNDLNPYINYPFFRDEALKSYVDEAHAHGLKAKVYYTMRELSNRTAELWALRSLGDEVLAPGPGGGHTWLREHLDPPYVPAWFTPGIRDVSFVTMPMSRWNNYYLEGLDWLARHVEIDGLYIDDMSYDRTVMQRARRILDERRPGSLIDLHSWNHFDARAGFACCLNLYMEHLPYIDRIWIGESRDYNTAPDYWLIEISGIPFGVMGEMLQDGGNPWRGMIYGMTARYPYMADPRPIWRLWDEFEMADSRMIGYWVPDSPVSTDQDSVLATAYVKPGKVLLSLASWSQEEVRCRLRLDLERLGLTGSSLQLRAPAIDKFQEAAVFRPDEPIPVEPGRGWLLILEKCP